jgi:ppGpp synthetase/RelA/SpoT-type nucleotidyltranferase
MHTDSPINLASFKSFRESEWVDDLVKGYRSNAIVAKSAINRLLYDLDFLNKEYENKFGRILFTTTEGRVKTEDSFFRKLYEKCCKKQKQDGISSESIKDTMNDIKDLAGARFACPYFDEVLPAINDHIRSHLSRLGYATDLQNAGLPDKNFLDEGDINGYRSYHFFVRVPTVINIFNDVELFTCEVQGRSELQHVWAVKCHDLIYRGKEKRPIEMEKYREDMKHISNNLRTMDHFLHRVRSEVGGEQC